MPRPPKVIQTTDPLGTKINQVMAEQGIAGEYAKLAQIFGVTTASAREWIKFGRLAKERYGRLVEWSGRSLHWWFDLPEIGRVAEPAAAYRLTPTNWPFQDISATDYALLDQPARAEAEAFVKGLLAAVRSRRHAA